MLKQFFLPDNSFQLLDAQLNDKQLMKSAF
jgi:hypothetical protein